MIYGSKLDDIFHIIRVILVYVAIIVCRDKEAVNKVARGHIIKTLRPSLALRQYLSALIKENIRMISTFRDLSRQMHR